MIKLDLFLKVNVFPTQIIDHLLGSWARARTRSSKTASGTSTLRHCCNVLQFLYENSSWLYLRKKHLYIFQGWEWNTAKFQTASPADANWKAARLFKAGLLKCVLNEMAKQGYTSTKRHGRACQSPSRLRCRYRWAIRDLLINSAANHRSPCFRPANLDFITGTYGTSTVHYCSALAPWPSGNLIPARREVNWDCLKLAALGLSGVCFPWKEACSSCRDA